MPKAPLQPIATLGIDIGKNWSCFSLDTAGELLIQEWEPS
jgi:hypothetical protein